MQNYFGGPERADEGSAGCQNAGYFVKKEGQATCLVVLGWDDAAPLTVVNCTNHYVSMVTAALRGKCMSIVRASLQDGHDKHISFQRFSRRKLVAFFGCLIVGLGSFYVTLRVMEKPSPRARTISVRAASEQLAKHRVENYRDLKRIAVQLELKPSPQISGRSEEIKRINERDVMMRGWAADPESDERSSVEVVVFVSGMFAARTQTKGERADITEERGLLMGSGKNVLFETSFACRTDEQPLIVAIGITGRYAIFPTPRCP